MSARLIYCALLSSLAFAAEPSATEILQRSAAAYRGLHVSEFPVTIQTVEGTNVSERQVTEPAARLQSLDQNVKQASIERQEKYVVNGKPRSVYVVRVVRDPWPSGTLPNAQFAMYRIDQQTLLVHKVITYSPHATEIVFYDAEPRNNLPQTTVITGIEAPDFTLDDAAGHNMHLRGLRGQVVIVDFWATWCPPCRALMPELQKLHAEYAKQGLVVLGLDVGEDAGTVTQFAKEKGYTFPLLLGAEPEVTARYFVTAYPTTFVIDRRGRIVYRDLGGKSSDDLRTAVSNALRAGGGR